jgi:hypothetical protein
MFYLAGYRTYYKTGNIMFGKILKNSVLSCLFMMMGVVNASDDISIKISQMPTHLSFPFDKGSNQILTTIIKGDAIKSVWLAPNKTSTDKIMLAKVDQTADASEYQINLADAEVTTLLLGSELQKFHIFVETVTQQIFSSVSVQYSIHARPFIARSMTAYIKKKLGEDKREKIDRWSQRSWYKPMEIEHIEIDVMPIEAIDSVVATIDIDGKKWTFHPDDSKNTDKKHQKKGHLYLPMTVEIRQAWDKVGFLSLYVDKKEKGVVLHAIPESLQLTPIPEAMTIFQRRSRILLGSNNYLSISLRDITAGQVLLSLKTKENTSLLTEHSIQQGHYVDFNYNKKSYRLSLLLMVNALLGRDYAVFLISPAIMTETQKISYLLQSLQHAKIRVLYKEQEYTGQTIALQLRKKVDNAKNANHNMINFIATISAESKKTGFYYKVVQRNGKTTELSQWFKNIVSAFIQKQ